MRTGSERGGRANFLLQGVFSRAITHLRQPLLVSGELRIQLGKLHINGLDAGLKLWGEYYQRTSIHLDVFGLFCDVEKLGPGCGLTFPMAPWRVGFGAVFLAPKRRFMFGYCVSRRGASRVLRDERDGYGVCDCRYLFLCAGCCELPRPHCT